MNGIKLNGASLIVVAFAACLVVAFVWKAAVGGLILREVPEGVTLEGVDIGGCRREEVEEIVAEMAQAYEREPIPAQYDQEFGSVIPELNGWRVDKNATIAEILSAKKGETLALVREPVRPNICASDYPLARIYQGSPAKKEMTLMINVDWGVPQPLMEMLDILDEYNVKTTFCVTGRITVKFPEIIAEICRRGHEIANHSYYHHGSKYNYKHLSVAAVNQQILKTEEAIMGVCSQKPRYFSPPAGILTDNIIEAAVDAGYRVVLWTPGLDTVDWQEPGVDVIAHRVLDHVQNGGIVLMHPKEQTRDALRIIIPELQERGYTIVPLRVLLSPYHHYEYPDGK